MGKRAWGLLVVSLLTMSCSGSADLSGDVFVTVAPGDVRRGADLEVILLSVTDAFQTEWSQVVDGFHAARARAIAAAKEAEGVQAQAIAERSAASQHALSLLLQQRKDIKDDVDWRAYDQASQRQIAAVQRFQHAGRRSREARAQLEVLVPRSRTEGWDLLKKYQARVVRTDDKGRFEFPGTAPGRYVLASRFRVAGDDVYWFIPVELKPGVKHATDLTERNAGWPLS